MHHVFDIFSSMYLWCLCTQRSTFQLVITTDSQRHVMILHYGRLDQTGTVNSFCDLLLTFMVFILLS